MTPELLELLTDSERAAHARLTLDRAAYAVENGAADPTCASCGVPVHVRAGCDFEPGEDVCDSCAHLRNATNAANLRAALTTIATLRDHLRKQQEAFIAGLELAQRTADAEIAELRATLANEQGEGPPIDGWRRNTTNDGVWERVLAMRPSWTLEGEGEPTDTLIVGRDDDVHWRWERYTDSGAGQRLVGGVGGIECARTAMRAADAAVKGAT
jgi:hypothetical protein